MSPPPPHGPRVWLGLGSNLAPRVGHLRAAVRALSAAHDGPGAPTRSSVYETAPWGPVPQPRFLNLVLGLETRMSPHALLDLARQLEAAAGRQREVRWGPRTLDVDLLLFGDRRVATADLTLPHPRYADRPFVLLPLAEVAPGRVDPRSGATLGALAADLPTAGAEEVVRVGDLFDPSLDALDTPAAAAPASGD